MRDVLDTAKDAWWVTLVIPFKMAMRTLSRMVIFTLRPEVFERVKQDYEREHQLRMQGETENTQLRLEIATLRLDNERLRTALAGLIDSSLNAPDGDSSSTKGPGEP